MSISFSGAPVEVELWPGWFPVLRVRGAREAVGWAGEHRDQVRAVLAGHGAVLVRGLGLSHPAEVAAVFHRLVDGLMTEREGFARRRIYADGVYSASTWPANRPERMHHELSYRLEFPGLMLFACLTAPAAGGAIRVADSSAVLEELPRDLVTRFQREGWLLVRNYDAGVGVSVADGFGTTDRGAVEAYCRANGIALRWRPGGGLRTWQRRRAVVAHPVTGRCCWFNQIAFLSEWALDPEIREFLVDVYGPGGLPFATRFGGGDPIGPDVVALLHRAYAARTVRVPWQAGDLLLVDNVRCAHGREPYSGRREVLVGMADPVGLASGAPGVEVAA